jgi:hypothetical protein
VSAPSSDTLILDEAMLADIRRRVATANPGARGSIVLNLQVGGDGVVRDAEIVGVRPNGRLTDALRSALIGRRLYRAGASHEGIRLLTVAIKFS